MAWNISVLLPATVLTEEVLGYLVVVLVGGGLEEGINDTGERSVKSAYILDFPLCPLSIIPLRILQRPTPSTSLSFHILCQLLPL